MLRRWHLAGIAILGASLTAGPPAAAAPSISLSVSSPVTYWGGSVKVKVTASEPGRVWLAQSRRYVIDTPRTGTCGTYDKYLSDGYGLHSVYLPERAAPVIGHHPVAPGKPYTATLQGSWLEFGAGQFPWDSSETWPGCRTRWTPYTRLSAYFASDASGLPGGSYYAEAERRVGLQRLF